jgi:hypothetical protein
LDEFFAAFSDQVIHSQLIAGQREKLYVLTPGQHFGS